MNKPEHTNPDYRQWLIDLKTKIRQSQIKVAVRVNEELLRLYWNMGQDIVVRQMEAAWGSGFFEKLSKDLRSEFPYMKGFSTSNLYYIKQFYKFYSQGIENFQQIVGEISTKLVENTQISKKQENIIFHQVGGELESHPIFQIPWRHHIEIFTRCKSVQEAIFYVKKTIENGWSRAILDHFLDADLYNKQGKAQTNFSRHLPEVQSDLANQILKDPWHNTRSKVAVSPSKFPHTNYRIYCPKTTNPHCQALRK